MSVRLYDVAHARTGDKGNLNTIAVIAYDPAWYPVLCEVLTPERVSGFLGERIVGTIAVHRMDNVCALVLVCARARQDTVTTSLYLDTHGKALGSVLLDLDLGQDISAKGRRLWPSQDSAPTGRAGPSGRPSRRSTGR